MNGGMWLIGLGALALLHTYVLYPAYLRFRTRWLPPEVPPPPPATFPFVSVLIAAYNEAPIIEAKLRTVLNLHYPPDRLRIYVGSDCSSDATNDIVAALTEAEPRLRFFPFTERRGKPGVVNELAATALRYRSAAADHVFLLTDANVLLHPDALRHLVRHFSAEPTLALVDTHLVHTRPQPGEVGASEQTYIGREVAIKYREGRLWRRMIGPFGGCYALRSTYFRPIPSHLLVDDFYLAMRAFAAGGGARNDLEAISYEAVGERMREEFRRKARISTGNVQNLLAFRRLWWPPTTTLAFAFISHKLMRWLGPFWLLSMALGALWWWRAGHAGGQLILAVVVCVLFLLPLIDWLLKRAGIRIGPLRAWRYFMLMNVALGVGWWRYFGTEQQGIWEPPVREN